MTHLQCIALMTTALLGEEDTDLTRQNALEKAISLYEFVKIETVKIEEAAFAAKFGGD